MKELRRSCEGVVKELQGNYEYEKVNNMNKYIAIIVIGLIAVAISKNAEGQEVLNSPYFPQFNGEIYTRYERFTGEEPGNRFQVRNARLKLSGEVGNYLNYTFQYDFCAAGESDIVDAFVRIKPLATNKFSFSVGYLRAPFTIDAHRSPAQQYFNHRSFLSKRGGVRDLGVMVEYNFNLGVAMTIQAGVYNGDGSKHQNRIRNDFMMYQIKYQAQLCDNLKFSTSIRNIKPENYSATMWATGATFKTGNLLIEGEYMIQWYEKNTFDNIHYVNTFAVYDFLIGNPGLNKISLLARYDYMSKYTDGKDTYYLNGKQMLGESESRRSRLTAGATFSLFEKPFCADIRLNYEKFFYPKYAIKNHHEDDRIVVGFVASF